MDESDPATNLNDLVRGQIPLAMRFAVRLTGNVHDAEDIVQEALLRAARSISTFEKEASFRTWLTRIIINVFRSRVSALSSGTAELNESSLVSGFASAEQLVESNETQQLIVELVNRLPARQKEVLILMTWEDHSAAEAADILGVSVQNVYSNLSAARTRLKQDLTATGVTCDGENGVRNPK
jgi:RNA polymerase sigma-70 factor, ECF subfamily